MTAAVRSTVLTEVGRETCKPLTADEARELTAEIRISVQEFLPKIRTAYQRRADLALGYGSWDAYCDAELSGLRMSIADRQEAVAGLRSDGMSTRAIGAALDVDPKTVRNDLAQVGTNSPPDAKVIGLDRKEHPASRPAPGNPPLGTPTPGPVEADAAPPADPGPEIVYHHHVGGSAGGPGENSAECACGVVFDGFDSHAEVAELLDRHIENPGPVESLSTAPAGSGSTSPELETPAPAAVTPPPGSPATWTAEEREANQREVERKRAVEACERTAESLVMEIRGMVTTIIDGLDCGAPGIPVSLAEIDECRAALDRLEARVINA